MNDNHQYFYKFILFRPETVYVQIGEHLGYITERRKLASTLRCGTGNLESNIEIFDNKDTNQMLA